MGWRKTKPRRRTEKPDDNHPAEPFLHDCEVCGHEGCWGYEVDLRAEKIGLWYCYEHRPEQKQKEGGHGVVEHSSARAERPDGV